MGWLWHDEDGVGNNGDAFINDPAASIYTDGDGYPDSWNYGKDEKDSTTGLELDYYPNDPDRHKKESTDSSLFFIIIIPVVLVILIVIIIGILIMIRKRKFDEETHNDEVHKSPSTFYSK